MRIGPTGIMAVTGTGILNKSCKKLKSVEAQMPAVRQKGWCHKIVKIKKIEVNSSIRVLNVGVKGIMSQKLTAKIQNEERQTQIRQ